MKSFLLSFFCLCGTASAVDWRPVDRAELQQKTPRVEPNADAEAIFWDVKIEDEVRGQDVTLNLINYVRIKIFTDRGKEKYATIEIPQAGKRRITGIAARTIKPDGTVIELKKDAIFEKDIAKAKGLRLLGKSFTLPNVEAGDVIEYQYREARFGEIVSYMRLYFQRDLPLWDATYHIKPLNIPYLPYQMRSMAFQCEATPFKKEPNGYFATSMTNVPAFHEEPYMPPEDELRSWMLIYYEEDKKLDQDKYWKQVGQNDYNRYKPYMKADDLVKKTAAELTSGIAKPEDKLAALDSFCRTKIQNVNSSAFHLTADERKAFKENHSPSDTLKRKMGTGIDVNLLFAAMANAEGYDARVARVTNRADKFFNKSTPSTYFLGGTDIAVNVNQKWQFFDPATPYLESSMLSWQEEGTISLVSDPKGGIFTTTQFLPAARSQKHRIGKFKLLEDGTLEGTVEYTFTGHPARRDRSNYRDETPDLREKQWKEITQSRLSTAEITGFEMTNLDQTAAPFTVRHNISVPGYAVRTGKRLLLEPAFFQRNLSPMFSEATRKWDLYFDYAWSEDDEVSIEFPAGWVLDTSVAPRVSTLGTIGTYDPKVTLSPDGRSLLYRRKFVWGNENHLLIPVSAYPQVKKVFEFIQEQDHYTVSLKAQANAK